MGLRHLAERLAWQLLTQLVDADPERLGRRVKAAAHAVIALWARRTLTLVTSARSALAAARSGAATARPTLRYAHVGASLVHRLLELLRRDPKPGGEGGDELLLVLLHVAL